MRKQNAAAFERRYTQDGKELKVNLALKPKRKGHIGGGRGHNIRKSPSSRIPGGVTYPEMTPKMAAAQEKREVWKSKRTWMGATHGWVLQNKEE